MWSAVAILLSLPLLVRGIRLDAPCTSDDDCRDPADVHADAAEALTCRESRCSCPTGLRPHAGSCQRSRAHGQSCHLNAECTFQQDPHLKCRPIEPGDDKSRLECRCRSGYNFEGGRCSYAVTRPPHIKIKKMLPALPGGSPSPDAPEPDFFSTLYNDKPRGKPNDFLHEPRVFGPLVVVCSFAVLVALTFCVCSIKGQLAAQGGAARNAARGANDAARNTYKPELPPSPPPSPPRNEKGDIEMGKSNIGFQADQQDNVSRFTTSTEICDASHKEYLERQHVPTAADQGEDGATTLLQRDLAKAIASANAVRATQNNIHYLFKHDPQQLSLTPSMDEADAEVAGIYKTYSSSAPLAVRMDSLSTPPPVHHSHPVAAGPPGSKADAAAGPHIIELIDTPDCTSIDTTIPEEEIRTLQGVLERRRKREEEEEKEEREKKEEKEDKPSVSSSADVEPEGEEGKNGETARSGGVSLECSGEEEEEQQQDDSYVSDYIDSVFKPVFSIS